MKIAIVGGHLTPALAVIGALPKGSEVIYIGRKHPAEGDSAVSLEYQTVTHMGIPFIVLSTAKLQRTFTRHTIPSLAKMPRGMMQAFRILKKHKPDIILSFGGYLSVPVGFAAYLLKIPVVIHEQTTQAGLSNKLVSFFAKKICISFDSSRGFFPKEKIILTGNPILQTKPTQEISVYENMKTDKPLLIVIGGSQGSHAINTLLEGCLSELLQQYTIIHQTGDAHEYNDFSRLEKLKERLPKEIRKQYLVVKFINPDDIWDVLSLADLVVSRSGINTVMTLALLNKPSILIPLPFGQRNEQLRNASMFVQTGLGIIAKQADTTPSILKEKIYLMHSKINSYKNNQLETMRELHLHAAEKIVDSLMRVLA